MKKIDFSTSIKDVFRVASKGEDHDLDRFSFCYHRYLGTGNHLYLLSDEDASEETLAICDRKNGGARFVVPNLKSSLKEFRLIAIDVEMGGMQVWNEKSSLEVRTQEA